MKEQQPRIFVTRWATVHCAPVLQKTMLPNFK